MANVKRLSVVALLKDVPRHGLVRGQVGTVGAVVRPGVCEVDFRDRLGASVSAVVSSDDLLPLHRERNRAPAMTLSVAAGRS